MTDIIYLKSFLGILFITLLTLIVAVSGILILDYMLKKLSFDWITPFEEKHR